MFSRESLGNPFQHSSYYTTRQATPHHMTSHHVTRELWRHTTWHVNCDVTPRDTWRHATWHMTSHHVTRATTGGRSSDPRRWQSEVSFWGRQLRSSREVLGSLHRSWRRAGSSPGVRLLTSLLLSVGGVETWTLGQHSALDGGSSEFRHILTVLSFIGYILVTWVELSSKRTGLRVILDLSNSFSWFQAVIFKIFSETNLWTQ